MAYLSTYSSAKTEILERLFPNGLWREIVAEIVWGAAEQLFASGEVLSFRVWRLRINVPRSFVELLLTKLIGAKP